MWGLKHTLTNSWWNSAVISLSLKTSFKVLSQVPKDFVWLEVFFSVICFDLTWDQVTVTNCWIRANMPYWGRTWPNDAHLRGSRMTTQMGKWQKIIISIIITAKETWFGMVNWKQLLMHSNMLVEKSGILNVFIIIIYSLNSTETQICKVWKMYFCQTCLYNCFLMSDNYLPNIDQYKL